MDFLIAVFCADETLFLSVFFAYSVGNGKVFAVRLDKVGVYLGGGGKQYLQVGVEIKQAFLSVCVQLGQHVVQYQYGAFAYRFLYYVQLRQLQRKRGGAQLSLAAETAYVHAVYFERNVVPLTACGSVAQLEVLFYVIVQQLQIVFRKLF